MFELASILGDSIESLLNHLTTQNGTYLSQYSAGQPAFGRKETLLVGCYRPGAAIRHFYIMPDVRESPVIVESQLFGTGRQRPEQIRRDNNLESRAGWITENEGV